MNKFYDIRRFRDAPCVKRINYEANLSNYLIVSILYFYYIKSIKYLK